jgi:hypothetical protein
MNERREFLKEAAAAVVLFAAIIAIGMMVMTF